MTLTLLQQYWALFGAGLVGTAVLLFALWRAWGDSRRGRLRAARRRLRAREAEAGRQRIRLQRLQGKLEGLQRKVGSVRPIQLQEAAEEVQDAESLLKIAGDQVLIARNHVRKLIVEEFPPRHHERMRRKYLPGEREDSRPFTF